MVQVETLPAERAMEYHHEQHEEGGEDELNFTARFGDVKMAFGTQAGVLARNPGWRLLDGTTPLVDGVQPPDMRDRVPIAAGTAYAVADVGGSATQASHGAVSHSAHDNNHSNDAGLTLQGGLFIINSHPGGAIGVTTGAHSHVAHSNHSDHAAESHGTNLPPYAAMWFLIYVG